MKTLFSIIILLFSNLYLFGQIELVAHIVDENNSKLKDIQVNIYDGNQLILSEKASKKFDFDLLANKHYTLELSKAGYYTKRIIVETQTGTSKPSEPFEFKIELIKNNPEIKENEFDFPVAVIKYKVKKGFYFISIKNYDEEKTLITQN